MDDKHIYEIEIILIIPSLEFEYKSRIIKIFTLLIAQSFFGHRMNDHIFYFKKINFSIIYNYISV